MSFEEFLNKVVNFFTTFGIKLLGAILVLIVGRLLIKSLMKLFRSGKLSKHADPTVAQVLNNFINILLNVILVITVIGILGVPMASVITILASAGVAVGLALQGALSNLAGGLMILFFRPFRIGDFIEAGSNSGTVKDIGIFYTVLHTPDNRVVTIPNGSVMGKEIINFSLNDNRRVDFTFSVAYGTDVAKVQRIILEEAGKHELVQKDPAPFCRLAKQNASSLDFVLRVWTGKDDYWTVNFDLLEAINNRFVAENIEVPFDQLDVHINPDKKEA